MNGRGWIPIAIVAVVIGAFALGWLYRGQEATEQLVAEQPAPATASAPSFYPAPAAPAATSRRPARRSTPATSSSSAAAQTAAEPAETPYEARAAEPVVRQAETRQVRLAEGTRIVFSLNDSLSTKTSREGDEFSGVVSQAVHVGDAVAIPEGSVVRGRVSNVKRAGRVKGRAELGLSFDSIELPSGQTYDLSASLSALGEGEKETVTNEGQVEGQGSKTRDAVTIGAGSGIGAAIGAIAGGGKGAAIGAGGGAAAGTAMVLLTRGKDVELKRGSEVAIQLDRPLTVRAQ